MHHHWFMHVESRPCLGPSHTHARVMNIIRKHIQCTYDMAIIYYHVGRRVVCPCVLLWWTGVRLKGKEGCRQPAWPRHSPIVPSGVPSPPPNLTIYCCVVRSLPRYAVARSKSGRMEGRLLPMPPFVAPSQLRCRQVCSLARA